MSQFKTQVSIPTPIPVQVNAPAPAPAPFQVTCPLCRAVNQIPTDQNKVVGVDQRCVICWDHTSEVFLPTCGHICLCRECCQHLSETQEDPFSKRLSDHAIEQLMNREHGNIYVIVPVGMGCSVYCRRRDLDQPIETFFMHGDDWGQYGDRTQLQALNQFIEGYTHVE